MSFSSGSGSSSSIAASTDVALNSVANGQALSYNSSTAKWTNVSNPGGPGSNVINVLNQAGNAYQVAQDTNVYIGAIDPQSLGITSGLWIEASSIAGNTAQLPSAPTAVSASPGDASITLTWNTATSMTQILEYKVYRNGTLIARPTTNQYVNTGLTNGTAYSYTISAVNSAGEGPQSSVAGATPVASGSGSTAPSMPAGSVQVDINDTDTGTTNNTWQFGGTWETSTSNSNAYKGNDHYSRTVGSTATVRFQGRGIRLYTAQAPHHGIVSVSIDGGATSNIDLYAAVRSDNTLVWWSPILTDGSHTVVFTVTGNKNASSTDTVVVMDRAMVFSTLSSDVNPPVVGAPTNLTAAPSSGSVALNWTAPSGVVTGYKVYRGSTLVGSPTQTNYTDTGLTNGTTYTYSVSAVNGSGESVKSSTASATPAAVSTATGYITRSGNKLQRNGADWWFTGYNSFVWSSNCGSSAEMMTTSQVDDWLDNYVRHDGHGLLRIFFFRGWSYSRLDHLIAACKRNNVYILLCIDDAIGGCGTNKKDSSWFNSSTERNNYKTHMLQLMNLYKNETTFLGFEYFNEPGGGGTYNQLRAFIDEMGAAAHAVDPNHLWSSGTVAPYWLGDNEGTLNNPNFRTVHESPYVDIGSIHDYDEGEVVSNHYDNAASNAAGKPVIIGECGITASSSGSGCGHSFATRASQISSKANTYIKTSACAGVLYWAWTPGHGSDCTHSTYTNDPALISAIRNAN